MSERESESRVGHTDPPWIYCEDDDGNGNPGFRVYSEGEKLPYLYSVAFVPMEGRSREEAEANARLIAAAPLLLEACRKVAATYGAECPDLENLTDADGERFGAMLHVVNAIAKAESGEDEES